MTTNGTTGWASAPLLARHYADLPRLLVQFVRGQRKDGPAITLDQAQKIITKVYGRASRCTYGGLALVAPAILNNAIEAEIGEGLAIAEAVAFGQAIGQMTINQPVCEQGHLPARWTGPTSIALVGSDAQCPICRSLVADPEATEFLLVWNQQRLGHAAEDQVEGADGRMVPTTAAGILEEIGGTLHPLWLRPVEGTTPSIEEIAMVLLFGTGDGKVEGLKRENRVFAALKNPESVGLDAYACAIVARKARNSWKVARNPFALRETPVPVHAPRPVATDTGRAVALIEFILSAFSKSELERLIRWNYPAVIGRLPDGPCSPAEYTDAAVTELARTGQIDHVLCGLLCRERPRRKSEIEKIFA